MFYIRVLWLVVTTNKCTRTTAIYIHLIFFPTPPPQSSVLANSVFVTCHHLTCRHLEGLSSLQGVVERGCSFCFGVLSDHFLSLSQEFYHKDLFVGVFIFIFSLPPALRGLSCKWYVIDCFPHN